MIFVCKSVIDIRKNETKIFSIIFHDYKKIYYFKNYIEGGDVIVKGNIVFVGLSSRTSLDAVKELMEVLPSKFKVVPIQLRKKILHLDTVLNYVGETAVFYQEGIKDKKFDIHCYFKNVIFVEKQHQKYLPTNFLSLDNKTILASKKNAVTNQRLKEVGIDVMEGSFYEMLKLGGSYRCCSLEIVKE